MHRLVMNAKDNEWVDHRFGDGLDNQKINLRTCTPSQNSMNKRVNINSISGYKGVCWCKKTNKWRAYIKNEKKQIYLGLFVDKKEAAKAYDKKAYELYGEFAKING